MACEAFRGIDECHVAYFDEIVEGAPASKASAPPVPFSVRYFEGVVCRVSIGA